MRRFLPTAIIASSLVGLLLVAMAPAVSLAGGGCHGGSEDAASPGDAQASTVKIDGCMFFPTIARVPVGTTVAFLNGGPTYHNVTGVSGEWASRELSPGDRFEHTFTEAGVYPFACTLHPGMNGAVVVGEEVAAAAPVAAEARGGGSTTESTTATQAAAVAPTAPGSDPLPFALAAVGGLALGLLLGGAAAFAIARPRAAADPAPTHGTEPTPAD